ncbi:MAG: type IV pilus twitching motility protein PilT [Planctomycetota bacterium]
MVSIEELLNVMIQRGGSDLHISASSPPKIRIDGKLVNTEYGVLSSELTQKLIYSILSSDQVAKFEKNLELDFAFSVRNIGRFRTNVFMQRGSVASVMRMIPTTVKSFEDLGLPVKVCQNLCQIPKGLVLVTGATGSGKSTTLAAMVDHINQSRNCHVVTIEDPIEFVHSNKNSLFNQREIGADTRNFGNALRSVLRQDPDVILIGEMRDAETIESALTLAETGHLTFATLHTSDAVQTINRIVDVFPAHQQAQIRTQLSFSLQAVFCQQLLPRAGGKGRVMACEVLIANTAVRSLIRDDKAHQINSIIQTGAKLGMKTMNQTLYDLYAANLVSYDDALARSNDQEDLKRMFRRY